MENTIEFFVIGRYSLGYGMRDSDACRLLETQFKCRVKEHADKTEGTGQFRALYLENHPETILGQTFVARCVIQAQTVWHARALINAIFPGCNRSYNVRRNISSDFD